MASILLRMAGPDALMAMPGATTPSFELKKPVRRSEWDTIIRADGAR
jgi:hypothetical protein